MRHSYFLIKPFVFMALTSLALSSCSSDGGERPEYLDANAVEQLEIPPKLSAPSTGSSMRIPEPSKMAKAVAATGRNQIDVIAPTFEGVELKNNGRLYWLEIDKPIENVWDDLKRFVKSEGMETSRVEKIMGFVETKWMNEYEKTHVSEKESGWFSSFSADYKDKFRLRIEPSNVPTKTHLFVSHRGLEININDEGSQWVQRNSNAELEREILYRYVLFSGAAKNSAENLLAGYRGYQSRIVTSSNASSFKIKGDANTVWQRLKIAMDRLGVDTLKENEKLRTLDILVNDLKAENIEESTSWFSSKTNDIDFDDDEYDLAAVKKTESDIEPLKLSVQQIADRKNSTIVIKFLDGKPIEDGKPKLFRDALLKQLN